MSQENKVVDEIFRICEELGVTVDANLPQEKNKFLSAWHKRMAMVIETSAPTKRLNAEEVKLQEEELHKAISAVLEKHNLVLKNIELQEVPIKPTK